MSQEIQNPHNKKSRRRLISNIIFLVLLSILVVTLILSLGEISKISAQFQEIAKGDNWKYLIAAVGLILAHFFLWPASQCIYGKALNIEATAGESYLIGCSEHFYNGITPFAAGGQPFQIYSYTKRNVCFNIIATLTDSSLNSRKQIIISPILVCSYFRLKNSIYR